MGATGAMIAASAAAAVAGAAASSLLTPKPPGLPKPLKMVDPLEQEEALKKSLLEQTARRGRLASILTDQGSGGKLGG